jgi:hypothetical protein
MTETREQMEARHAAERAALEAREVDPLSRDAVRDALRDALELTDTPIEFGDFACSETHNYRGNIEAVVDRLHAALRRGMELGRVPALGEAGVEALKHLERWVANWCELDLSEVIADNGGTAGQFVQHEAKSKIAMIRATLSRVPVAPWPGAEAFPLGCEVRKKSGPEWQGKVVGYYSSSFTPEGLVIECIADGAKGQVHVEPAKRMERAHMTGKPEGGEA